MLARELAALAGLVVVLLETRLRLPHPGLAVAAFATEAIVALLPRSERLWSGALAGGVAVFSTVALVVANGGVDSPLVLLWFALTAASLLAVRRGTAFVAGGSLAALAPVLRGGGWHVSTVFAAATALCGVGVATERLRARRTAELEALEATDSLTGVNNRAALDRRLETFFSTPEPRGALVMIDLDDFREVNKGRGHAEGDRLLKAVGAALTRVLPGEFVARAGSDEFVVLLEQGRDPLALAQHVLRVIADAGPPGLALTATAGVACVPEDGAHPDEVRAAAEQALGWGKADGKARALRFDGQRALSRPEVEAADIRRLWLEDRISISVQPIIDIRVGRVRGYEALAHFNVEGDASPLRWFALAERVGLRPQLELACLKQSLRLFEHRPPGTFLSVNLSPDLLELSVAHTTLGAIADLRGLVLELTEDAVIEDYDRLAGLLAPHLARGLKIAVDDFGAGRANLRHAWSILPSYLKLDRTLVSRLDSDDARRALVGSIVAYADDVGATLIAEGIETAAELNAVRQLGVSFVQGFLLAAPSPPWPQPDLHALLAKAADAAASHDPELLVVSSAESAGALQKRFAWHPRATAAVLQDEGGRVVGFLTRNRLLVVLGVRFGFALHADQPVLAIADTEFVWTQPTTNREELVARVLARSEDRRFDPVLLLDGERRLLGKLTFQELLEPAVAALALQAHEAAHAAAGAGASAVLVRDRP